jgi:His-Xaa-Ser system radical SAM maturase HxsC
MCCQPPKDEEDYHFFFQRNLQLIENADEDTDYVCITGGEPTLNESVLFKTIHTVQLRLPEATIHLLTNGRKFSDVVFVAKFEKLIRERIVIGIPLHSDNYIDHDMIAGAKGAFYETIKGLQNLGILGFQVELRVILLQQNIRRLAKIAEFISLNLPFVSQVSIMGLEITGLAEKNYSKVWIDPMDCTNELVRSVKILEESHIHCRLFNMPLCLLSKKLWKYAVQSISTWKKTNVSQCDSCLVRDRCCGLFSTSSALSDNIRAITFRDL